jgi:hypothetical protein
VTRQQDAEIASLQNAVNVFLGTYGPTLLFGWVAFHEEYVPLMGALTPAISRVLGELSRRYADENSQKEDGECTTYEDVGISEAEKKSALCHPAVVPNFEEENKKDS